MPTTKGLSVLTVEVNDRIIEYKPNSLEYTDGFGNLNVRHQTGGGPSGSKIITEDAETKIGMVKFVLYTEIGNTNLLKEWLRLSRRAAGNVIRLSGDGFTRSFRNMVITEEPTVSVGSEGEFEVIFKGDVSA